MAVIQAMSVHQCYSFDDFAATILRNLLARCSQGETVVDVYDRYDYPMPVKAVEKECWAASLPAKVYQVTGGRDFSQ